MRLRIARVVGWPYRHHPDVICFAMRALFVTYVILTITQALH